MQKSTHCSPLPQARRQQRGFGLVELSISLTLIAALLMGAFYLVRNIRDDIVRKEFTESATKVMSSASKYLAGYRDSSDITTDLFLRLGGWPSTMKIDHPAIKGGTAARSSIPGAWEDVSYNLADLTYVVGKANVTYAKEKEAMLYRVNAVPKERCADVVTELARYPSVGMVFGRAYTKPAAPPNGPAGFSELARGSNLDTTKINNVVLSGANIKTICSNSQSEIMAVIVRD